MVSGKYPPRLKTFYSHTGRMVRRYRHLNDNSSMNSYKAMYMDEVASSDILNKAWEEFLQRLELSQVISHRVRSFRK